MPTLKSVKKKLSDKIDNLKVGEMILREEISTLKSDVKRNPTLLRKGFLTSFSIQSSIQKLMPD